MIKHHSLFWLLALGALALVLGGPGCSEEKAKETVKEEAPATVTAPPEQEQEAAPGEVADKAPEQETQPAEGPQAVPEGQPSSSVEAEEATAPVTEVEEETSEEAVPPAETSTESQSSPTVVVIKASLWETHSKGPVELTHDKHAEDYEIACAECHHVYENEINVFKEGDFVQKCQECHNEPTQKGEKKLTPDLKARNLKLAYHKNCRNCHRQVKKEDQDKKPPVTCKGCHQAKEG
jgi:hypothetical protein